MKLNSKEKTFYYIMLGILPLIILSFLIGIIMDFFSFSKGSSFDLGHLFVVGLSFILFVIVAIFVYINMKKSK